MTHAAGESSPGNLPSGTFAIVLAARDETHLCEVETALLQHEIPHVAVREPDQGGALMAIGLRPVEDRRTVRRVLGRLPLLT